ncbi:CYTOMATRIX PROTEIN-LIKE PROTEIN [Salix koriyanagi]|uniref:CYTOMATRIX PROTEIN-LIKE PROTEIN n=1 Tax=Salix koriyanagi TaxID=2511006 RepID=A0A9Q0SKS2_9ROSI|nr:CYTOMATRIX PROTEIN-LIKE PROTEIN [Salix koriyanagi]
MGTSNCTKLVTSDREKWDKVFGGLVNLLKSQQEQLETLLKERHLLEDRIKTQHERWVSDIRLYEDHIAQINGDMVKKDMACVLEAAKGDLMLGLKQREASLHKCRLEETEDELADFQALFSYLSQNSKANSEATSNGKGGRSYDLKSGGAKKLEAEVERLKLENEKLVAEKNSEVSALLKEKTFVWNQYNNLESNLTSKLRSKEAEVENANEKIADVLATAELLQSSNDEKDEIIRRLNTKVAKMEADTEKWKEEISKLSRELEFLRKSRSAQVTSIMKPCSAQARTSTLGSRSCGRDISNLIDMKVSTPILTTVPSKGGAKGSRSLKKKRIDISETPKLFSSTFKVPKVKVPSTPS